MQHTEVVVMVAAALVVAVVIVISFSLILAELEPRAPEARSTPILGLFVCLFATIPSVLESDLLNENLMAQNPSNQDLVSLQLDSVRA